MIRTKWTLSELTEFILGLLAFLWGILFCLPGNVLIRNNSLSLLSLYAADWVWGILLIMAGLTLVFLPKNSHFKHKKTAIFFLFSFWMGITILFFIYTARNGLQTVDFLIGSLFIVIASLHITLYARLAKIK